MEIADAITMEEVERAHKEARRLAYGKKPKDKSDPCPLCGKPFKTCGHF